MSYRMLQGLDILLLFSFHYLPVDTTNVLQFLFQNLIFLPSTIKLWNELPQPIVDLDSLNDVKEIYLLTSSHRPQLTA